MTVHIPKREICDPRNRDDQAKHRSHIIQIFCIKALSSLCSNKNTSSITDLKLLVIV
ncbi:hypothetical protein [Paenibacillus sp. JCM 10914]